MYKPKKKEEYIASCRYYGGEDTCPPDVPETFWNYEQVWVDSHFHDGGQEYLKNNVEYYKSCGLGNFLTDDGTPIAMKAILWNRYEHWCYYDTSGFKDWYKREYLKMTPTNSEKL